MKFHFRRGGPGPLTRGLYILLIFFIGTGVGCTKSASQSSIVVSDEQISPQPPRVGPITVNFKLTNDTKPLVAAHISLEGDMTHAGMAPVFGDAHEVAPGRYQGQLMLGMRGDWVVLIHITLPGGKKVEKQMNISEVQSN